MNLFFLKIDRVPSKSNYAHHADWIECLGFSLDKISPGNMKPIGPKEVQAVLRWGIHSPILARRSGEVYGSAVLEMGVKNEDAKFTLIKRLRMTSVMVDVYYNLGRDNEQISLVCAGLAYEFWPAT